MGGDAKTRTANWARNEITDREVLNRFVRRFESGMANLTRDGNGTDTPRSSMRKRHLAPVNPMGRAGPKARCLEISARHSNVGDAAVAGERDFVDGQRRYIATNWMPKPAVPGGRERPAGIGQLLLHHRSRVMGKSICQRAGSSERDGGFAGVESDPHPRKFGERSMPPGDRR